MTGTIRILATGGTIAGKSGSPLERDYRPGQISIRAFIGQAADLGVEAVLEGEQIANIGSENIGPDIWRLLHERCLAALADPECAGLVITHGTDTAEETAFLLDLTLPTAKPVVVVGAMRAADAVGSDGLRNFANAVRVAGDADSAGRGVLLVMSDRVLSARDARKARTTGTDAFAGYPRTAIAAVAPQSLEWFGAPWRVKEEARYPFPARFPEVAVILAVAGMSAKPVTQAVEGGAKGIVVAGFGDGNMPDAVRLELAAAARAGVPVVRASRTDEGLVDREREDDANGFVAARALGPAKARILLQLLIADGVTEASAIQREFDRR